MVCGCWVCVCVGVWAWVSVGVCGCVVRHPGPRPQTTPHQNRPFLDRPHPDQPNMDPPDPSPRARMAKNLYSEIFKFSNEILKYNLNQYPNFSFHFVYHAPNFVIYLTIVSDFFAF